MRHTLILLCLTMLVMPAQIKRVLDGDTFALWAFGPVTEEKIRVLGVDATELHDPGGKAAREFAWVWLMAGPFDLTTCKKDSFGRWLGTVSRNGEDLGQMLIQHGYGVPYPKKER